MVPLLARLALPTDVAVLNWGLHYSPAYWEQLLTLSQQVAALPCGPYPLGPVHHMTTRSGGTCLHAQRGLSDSGRCPPCSCQAPSGFKYNG